MTAPDLEAAGHVRVSVRHMAGALRPAQVTPYCGGCNVAWPCPTAALREEQDQPQE